MSSAKWKLGIVLPPVLTVPSWSSKASVARNMLKRVGESRHPCWTPTVVQNQSKNAAAEEDGTSGLVMEVFDDSNKVGADVVLLYGCPQSCMPNPVKGLRKEVQTAVVWSCLPFIRSGQNHLARHSKRGKKTRQTEEEVGRQHQGMDRLWVQKVLEGSGQQGKMEETGCKFICGAPTTLAVKELMMMMMNQHATTGNTPRPPLKETKSLCL